MSSFLKQYVVRFWTADGYLTSLVIGAMNAAQAMDIVQNMPNCSFALSLSLSADTTHPMEYADCLPRCTIRRFCRAPSRCPKCANRCFSTV